MKGRRAARRAQFLLLALNAALLAGETFAQAAQPYPAKPIRMVTATATGGATDIMARLTAAAMSERLGVQVGVENLPGGANIPGTSEIAGSREFVAQLSKFGSEKVVEVLDDFAKSIRAERVQWHQIARDSNIRLTE